jgi:membrane protease YdiL (CAAX protease family)
MMRPPENDPNQPYPNVRSALMLTMLAILAAGFTGMAFIDFGLLAAVGIGQAIGVGAVATMGAQRVPEPQAARLGLRGLDLESIPLILCLVPAILLASELDNIAVDWVGDDSEIELRQTIDAGDPVAPREDQNAYDDPTESIPATEQESWTDHPEDYDGPGSDESPENAAPLKLVDVDDPASVLQAFVVIVGISPIVEEFLFRGVIQQGLVQRLGLMRGISVVALLWTLLRPAPVTGFGRFAAAALASFALGWALGITRIATGSILGPILLASGWAAIGLAALVLEGRIDLPGMNVDGTHLPLLVTLASLGMVTWAGRTIFQEAEKRFAQVETPERTRSDEPPQAN